MSIMWHVISSSMKTGKTNHKIMEVFELCRTIKLQSCHIG